MALKVSNAALCGYCQPIFYTRDLPETYSGEIYQTWQPDLVSFQKSAEAGCPLCSELWLEMVATEWPEPRKWQYLRPFQFIVGYGTDRHWLRRKKNRDPLDKWYIEFTACEPTENPENQQRYLFGQRWFQIPENMSISPNPPSSAPLEGVSTRDLTLAHQWLKQCQEEHTTCQHSSNLKKEVPSRLIELCEIKGHRTARLVLREEFPENVRYLTLSHCWGSGPIYSLRSNLLDDFRVNISIQSLPSTFQDMIDVTLRLGYSYVWVDSLCILQDDALDWSSESNRMADVYEHASLNIAATAFTSSTSGLFVPKKTERTEPLIVSTDIRLKDHSLTGTYVLISGMLWSSRVDTAPLNRRAWVLQERFFSPRILHFGKDQLLWECQEQQACEMFPGGLPELMYNSRRAGYTPYRTIMSLNPDINRERFQAAWYKIIEAYTVADLTFSSDKLYAIAGIRHRFETILNDTCIYGQWWKSFTADILWCRAWGDLRRLPRASNLEASNLSWRAPSWSWACLDCRVLFPLMHLPLGLIATAKQVQGQFLRELHIQGPLLKAICQYRGPETTYTLATRNRVMKVRVRYDASVEDFEGLYITSDTGTDVEQGQANKDIQPIWVYVLFVSSKAVTAGLLLKPLVRSASMRKKRGFFERIGYFDTYFDGSDAEAHNIKPLADYLEDSYKIPAEDYSEQHGDGIYSVVIV